MTRLQVRPLRGFSRAIAQMTRPRARAVLELLGVEPSLQRPPSSSKFQGLSRSRAARFRAAQFRAVQYRAAKNFNPFRGSPQSPLAHWQ